MSRGTKEAPRSLTGGLLLATVLAAPAAAQTPSAGAWRELTLADLEAARDLLVRNHPGTAAETGDADFLRTLERGYEAARRRAGQVSAYEGYAATLTGFAVSLGDPHIRFRTSLTHRTVQWPGFVLARRGGVTVVGARAAGTDSLLPAVGAVAVSCDGTPIADLARERLGTFRGDWTVEAHRVRYTPLLLVDDGNPFLTPPARCVIDEPAGQRTVELRWRPIAPADLQNEFRRAVPPARAGYLLRRVGDGWWIGMEGMNPQVAPLLDSVRAHLEALRAAPWVVVDVRGNGGGSSEWGRRLAALLVGEERTGQAMESLARAAADQRCGASWRASEDVEHTLEGYIRDLGPQLGPEATARFRAELLAVREARRAGRELAPAPERCEPESASRPSAAPPSRMSGSLILLTDQACFSSCLSMTMLFLALGARQVGEATDYSTHYMEVRDFPLPSGLGTFSTLQKVAFAAPRRLGPFEPAVKFPGRMDDRAALEAWIVGLGARN